MNTHLRDHCSDGVMLCENNCEMTQRLCFLCFSKQSRYKPFDSNCGENSSPSISRLIELGNEEEMQPPAWSKRAGESMKGQCLISFVLSSVLQESSSGRWEMISICALITYVQVEHR